MRREKYGTRDLAFSAWHRSIPRDDFTYIDIDCAAYCNQCKQVIYLIELALDVGQQRKTATVTRNLANRIGVPALVVLYQTEPSSSGEDAIVGFRVQKIAPEYGRFHQVEPGKLVQWFDRTRRDHAAECSCGVTHELREVAA